MECELFTEIFLPIKTFPISFCTNEHLEIFDKHLECAKKYLVPENFIFPDEFGNIFDRMLSDVPLLCYDYKLNRYECDIEILTCVFEKNLSRELFDVILANFHIYRELFHVLKHRDHTWEIKYYDTSRFFDNASFDINRYGMQYSIEIKKYFPNSHISYGSRYVLI